MGISGPYGNLGNNCEERFWIDLACRPTTTPRSPPLGLEKER